MFCAKKPYGDQAIFYYVRKFYDLFYCIFLDTNFVSNILPSTKIIIRKLVSKTYTSSILRGGSN